MQRFDKCKNWGKGKEQGVPQLCPDSGRRLTAGMRSKDQPWCFLHKLMSPWPTHGVPEQKGCQHPALGPPRQEGSYSIISCLLMNLLDLFKLNLFIKSAGAEKESNPSFQHLIGFKVLHIGKKLSKFQPVPFFHSKETNAFICHTGTAF